MKTLSVHLVAAARPNFMKIAPLYHALAARAVVPPADRPHRPALRREHVGRVLPRPAAADATFSPRGRQRQPRRADRRRDDRVREGRGGREAGLDRGRGRREFDRGLRDGRHQALDSGRAPRGGLEERRSSHARGDQPARDRCDLRRALDAVAGRRRAPRARGRGGRQDRSRRQHHDRLVRDDALRDRGGRHARFDGPRAGQLRRRHAASSVERGPSREPRAARASTRGRVEGPAAGVRRASPHAQEARGVRVAGVALAGYRERRGRAGHRRASRSRSRWATSSS